MVDGVASPVHGRAVREVADVVHEQGAGQRRAYEACAVGAFEMPYHIRSKLIVTPTWHVRIGADALRMVDAVARPVHRSAIGQIANLTQNVGALPRAGLMSPSFAE